MASHPQLDRTTLYHPSLSTDNGYLAFISSNQNLWIINLRTGNVVQEILLPKAIQAILSQIQILKWAPDISLTDYAEHELQAEVFERWLLLAGGHRLIVLNLDLKDQHNTATFPISTDARVIADYQFESHNGSIVTADFVFDHRQALVTFEMNIHASLVHFNRPQRDDIPSPKFADDQGIAKADSPYFAILLRSKFRDQIAVFTSKDSIAKNVSTFLLETTDAQGLMWSPNQDPTLIVWDSAVYGPNINFFTALGHPLKQLDLRPENLIANTNLQGFQDVGITCLNWKSCSSSETLLAIGCGGPRLIIRSQNQKKMSIATTMQHEFDAVIDGSQCVTWQQSGEQSFENQKAVFELQLDQTSEIDMISFSSGASAIATKLNTLPKVVWIWKSQNTHPAAIIQFQHDIKQILWHPRAPDVLAVTTSERTPFIYIFHDLDQPPQRVVVPFEEVVLTSKWIAQWVYVSFSTRCPMMISSKRHFEVGMLNHSDGVIVFKSLLKDYVGIMAPEEESSLLETPSKAEKGFRPITDWKLGDTTSEWGATSDLEKW